MAFTNTNLTCRELTCAGLDALGPRVIKLRVAFIATFVKPSTAASTTTQLVEFLDDTALGACVWNRRGGAYNICIIYDLVGLWTHAHS